MNMTTVRVIKVDIRLLLLENIIYDLYYFLKKNATLWHSLELSNQDHSKIILRHIHEK